MRTRVHTLPIRWDGEYEALSRLIFGLGTKFEEAAAKSGLKSRTGGRLARKARARAF